MDKNHDTLIGSLINNAMDAAKLTTFTALGIASKTTFPLIGTALSPAVPVGLFALDIGHDIYKAGHVGINDTAEIRELRHKSVADAIVNGGIAMAATAYVANHPEMSVPVIGFIAIADVLLAGDNSPIEYLKDGIKHVIDYIPYV